MSTKNRCLKQPLPSGAHFLGKMNKSCKLTENILEIPVIIIESYMKSQMKDIQQVKDTSLPFERFSFALKWQMLG